MDLRKLIEIGNLEISGKKIESIISEKYISGLRYVKIRWEAEDYIFDTWLSSSILEQYIFKKYPKEAMKLIVPPRQPFTNVSNTRKSLKGSLPSSPKKMKKKINFANFSDCGVQQVESFQPKSMLTKRRFLDLSEEYRKQSNLTKKPKIHLVEENVSNSAISKNGCFEHDCKKARRSTARTDDLFNNSISFEIVPEELVSYVQECRVARKSTGTLPSFAQALKAVKKDSIIPPEITDGINLFYSPKLSSERIPESRCTRMRAKSSNSSPKQIKQRRKQVH